MPKPPQPGLIGLHEPSVFLHSEHTRWMNSRNGDSCPASRCSAQHNNPFAIHAAATSHPSPHLRTPHTPCSREYPPEHIRRALPVRPK